MVNTKLMFVHLSASKCLCLLLAKTGAEATWLI
jgi:hypothetical protein